MGSGMWAVEGSLSDVNVGMHTLEAAAVITVRCLGSLGFVKFFLQLL